MQVTEPHNAAQPLEQVISSVRAAAEDWHLAPDDMIFLNGSRVEGFENQHSDVDIWLVSKSDPQSITSIPCSAGRMGYTSTRRHMLSRRCWLWRSW